MPPELSHVSADQLRPGPLSVWVLSDGKPGHENQSLGLAEALARLTPCTIHTLRLPASGWMGTRCKSALQQAKLLPAPDVILAAGHATHLPLWLLARRHHAPSVVLMKPSLPLRCFDVCIAPSHDFPQSKPPANVITTRGALNRVVLSQQPRTERLILVGGPSKLHQWDPRQLIDQLRTITADAPSSWQLTNSRRTPVEFMSAAMAELPQVRFHPHETTPSGWLPELLGRCSEVWVTEDSVSMIYEALSSGAKVGLLHVPRAKSHARVLAGLQRLIAEGLLCPYEQWLASRTLAPPPFPLREADRCAELLLAQIHPPSRSSNAPTIPAFSA